MFNNSWFKKEKPLPTLIGLGGGATGLSQSAVEVGATGGKIIKDPASGNTFHVFLEPGTFDPAGISGPTMGYLIAAGGGSGSVAANVPHGNAAPSAGMPFGGGRGAPAGAMADTMDYVTIATTSNAVDFGNLTVARRYLGSTANQTRALIAGGYTNPSPSPEHWEGIDYLTIATTGNSSDFGDMSDGIDQNEGNASAVRALFGGGHTGSVSNMIEYVTIATLGNAKDFGDLSAGRHDTMSASSSIRGIWSGGATPSKVDTIDYVQIASTGNATDFGNLSAVAAEGSGLSNGHGGLG